MRPRSSRPCSSRPCSLGPRSPRPERLLLTLSLLAACGGASQEAPVPTSARDEGKQMALELGYAEEEAQAEAPSPKGAGGPRRSQNRAAPARGGGTKKESKDAEKADPAVAGGSPADPEGGDAAPTRSWFPETFLFQPRVVTDRDGRASVPVRIPDRLTTWRVLGLAWSRQGGQSGDTTELLGTLPVYVDPVLPAFLKAGDRLRLPIQVVNTTDGPLTVPLRVNAGGAAHLASAGTVSLPAGGSRVSYVELFAEQAGTVSLEASIGSKDAVVRTFPVEPVGRKLEQTRGGTLAAPRQVELIGATDLDPASARVRLLVYPGAKAILQSELATALDRGGVASTGYSLLLSGQGAALLQSLGVPVSATGADDDARAAAAALHDMGLLAGQRAVRLGRAPDTAAAALLAEGCLAHPESPVIARLGERLLGQLVAGQRPDGTFGGDSSGAWTLQRLLLATADAAATVRRAAQSPTGDKDLDAKRKRDAAAVSLRAGGAFERYAAQVTDPYTAAAVLRSGAVSGDLALELQGRVEAGLVENLDGSKSLPVPEGVVRADGAAPSGVEATAMAVLALEGRGKAEDIADLGASLLGAWRPGRGWSDGRTDLLALQAVLALFKDPMPKSVTVTLSMDGAPVGKKVLGVAELDEVSLLDLPATAARGLHTWTVSAEPPVPGLGFALTLESWVPFVATPQNGLELQVTTGEAPAVGRKVPVMVQAAAPAGMALVYRQELPAGVVPDMDSLQALVTSGTISKFDTEDGALSFDIPALSPGQVFSAGYSLVPTLAGTLHSGPASLSPAQDLDVAALSVPAVWTVR